MDQQSLMLQESVVDEAELIRNLTGKIKFAGLDTFENEPTPSLSIPSP